MNQSKVESALEAVINIATRAPINMVVNIVIFPSIFGQEITISQNILIVVIFTIISISTSYCIRRFFNKNSIIEVSKCQLKSNPQTHGFQSALEPPTIGLARNAKQNMKKALKDFIVAIYFLGVTALSDGVKITSRLFVLVAINGLAVTLLILVFG